MARLGSYGGVVMAMGSAALFGASTPLAKLLLGGGVDPWLLAGLLYLGSGIGLGLYHVAQRLRAGPAPEAPLQRADLPWLGLIVLVGGVIGPILLMIGLVSWPAPCAAICDTAKCYATIFVICFAPRRGRHTGGTRHWRKRSRRTS